MLDKFGLSSVVAPAKTAPEVKVDPEGATEGRWIVDEVTRDIAEMLLFASDPNLDASQELELSVSRKTYDDVYEVAAAGPKGEAAHTVTLKRHVWSADGYAPFAAALLKTWHPELASDGGNGGAAPDADGIALALHLTEPTISNIIQEERRLSGLLNKKPLDPELHEQAAVIIGTFALREYAGWFHDIRPALCRMAAHLSLARALRPTSGTCGTLAEAIQSTLAGRQAEALELVAKLPADLGPWITALKMRNIGDWRLCPHPNKATLLEQVTWARASIRSISPAPVRAFLAAYAPESKIPDWSRAVMDVSFGVENGHVFVKPSIGLELADFAAASQAWDGRPPKGPEMLSFLNAQGERAVGRSSNGFELAVLGWGQIAAHYQRHLCWAIFSTDDFLRNVWGVPDQAASLEQTIHARFSGLRMYPLLVRRLVHGGAGHHLPKSAFDKAMSEAVQMCKEQPQLISSAHWALLAARADELPEPPPAASEWFQPTMPQGTVFDFAQRIYGLRLPPLRPGDGDYAAYWEKMRAVAPYNMDILHSYIAAGHPAGLTRAERDKEVLKTVAEFNVHAMREIAHHVRADARAFASAMNLVCALDPDEYLVVGEVLADAGFKDEAAVAYQAAFDKAPDRVWMANSSEWIVNYYYDKGRKEDALKIAMHAAEVYSSSGLQTAARLMERMEKWEEAAGYYAAIAERYDAPGELMQFASRRKEHDPQMAALYQKMVGVSFPTGMKKVALSDFAGEPRKGVKVTGTSEHTHRWKLRAGDIIVALDGIRVENFPQYDAVRSLQRGSTPLALIIWDGMRYRELSASVPDRRFGCGMDTYDR